MISGLNKKLWILLGIIFLISVFYSFWYQIRPIVDAGAYDRIGWNLARGCGYVENDGNCGYPEPDDAIGRVGPGYEFFLAANYKIFGHRPWIIWIWQAVFRALAAWFVYKIAKLLFEREAGAGKIALLSAALFGFSPDLILLNGLLLIETFFLFLFAAAVYFGLLALVRNELRYTALFSLFLGLSIMTRPTPFLILAAAFAVFLFRSEWKKAFLLLLFPILLITPWALRNWDMYHHLILTSSTGGYDLWVGNNPEATGGFDKTEEIIKFRRQNGIIASDREGWIKYFEFIKEEPLKFIDLQYDKAAYYFSLMRPTGFWPHLSAGEKIATLAFSGMWTLILFAFGLAGLAYMFNSNMLARDGKLSLFFIFAALQPLAVIPIIVETRYRYPFFLFLAIAAAYAVFRTVRGNDIQIRKFVTIAALFLVAISFFDVAKNFGLIAERISDLF